MIQVQVVYALPHQSTAIDCTLDEHSNILQAITKSNILVECQINLANHTVGIYGKPCELNEIVKNGDRVEIYRPLINDPKEIRRRKAASKKSPRTIKDT